MAQVTFEVKDHSNIYVNGKLLNADDAEFDGEITDNGWGGNRDYPIYVYRADAVDTAGKKYRVEWDFLLVASDDYDEALSDNKCPFVTADMDEDNYPWDKIYAVYEVDDD